MTIRTPGNRVQRRSMPGRAAIPWRLAIAGLLLLSSGARTQQATEMLQVPANPSMHPAPEQPMQYSHRTHVALGLDCETCHTGAEPNAPVGYPRTATCMGCHTSIGVDLPGVMRLAEFAASEEPIPWVRVYEVLAGVAWDHQPHLSADVECGACHGDMALADTTAMTTSVTSMASCISCHQAHEADTACALCHAWPVDSD